MPGSNEASASIRTKKRRERKRRRMSDSKWGHKTVPAMAQDGHREHLLERGAAPMRLKTRKRKLKRRVARARERRVGGSSGQLLGTNTKDASGAGKAAIERAHLCAGAGPGNSRPTPPTTPLPDGEKLGRTEKGRADTEMALVPNRQYTRGQASGHHLIQRRGGRGEKGRWSCDHVRDLRRPSTPSLSWTSPDRSL